MCVCVCGTNNALLLLLLLLLLLANSPFVVIQLQDICAFVLYTPLQILLLLLLWRYHFMRAFAISLAHHFSLKINTPKQ
jgi:hypothetical protein